MSDIKGIMPIQDSKLLDECKNNGVNITNKETGRNGKQPWNCPKENIFYGRQCGKTYQMMESIK